MKKFLVVLSFAMISLARGQITNAMQEITLNKETQQPVTTQKIESSEQTQKLSTTKVNQITNKTNTAQDLKETIPNEILQKLKAIDKIDTLSDDDIEFVLNGEYETYGFTHYQTGLKVTMHPNLVKDTGFFYKNLEQAIDKKFAFDIDFKYENVEYKKDGITYDILNKDYGLEELFYSSVECLPKDIYKYDCNHINISHITDLKMSNEEHKFDVYDYYNKCMKYKKDKNKCLANTKANKMLDLYTFQRYNDVLKNRAFITPKYVKKYFGDAMGIFAEPYEKDYIYDYVYGFLYISRFPCGLHNFYGMQCSEDDYSVSFFLTYNPYAEKITDSTGCGNSVTSIIGCNNSKGSYIKYIVPIDYDKIKPLLNGIDINNELNKNQYFTIPVKLRPKAIVCGYNESKHESHLYFNNEAGSFFSGCGMRIDKIIKTNNYKRVKEYIKKYDCDKQCPKDDETCQSEKTCACFKDLKDFDFFLYPRSNDIYVNVRAKPNAKSKIVAKVFTHYKKDKKYSYDNDVYYAKDLKLLIMNKELVSNEIKNTHKDIIEIDRFYSKAKVINGWWDVSFKDNNGKMIKGYVYKSELSYGVGLVSYKTCGFWGIESDE